MAAAVKESGVMAREKRRKSYQQRINGYHQRNDIESGWRINGESK